MSREIHYHFDVPGDDFTRAGEASSSTKMSLKKLGLSPELIRRVAIVMYEAEINCVIHATGGTADVTIDGDKIVVVIKDTGPGIEDIEKAMTEGFSTASNEVRQLGFGAGMGLPNIKRYSDHLIVDSTVGVGTTVTATINLK